MAMTKQDYEERIDKAQDKLLKIEKRIKKWEDAKSEEKFAKDNEWMHDDVGWRIGWDGRVWKFDFEDNAKSFSQVLKNVAKLMKREGLDPEIESKDVADLAKLLDDNLLGDEMYDNLKANLTFIEKIRELKTHEHEQFYTNYGYYDSGNNLCYFGEKNAMNLIRKPEVFKENVITKCIENNKLGLLKKLELYSEEVKNQALSYNNKQLKIKIEKTKKVVKKAKLDLAKYEKELKKLESK